MSVTETRPLRPARRGSARYLRTHGRLLLRVARNDLGARHAGSQLGLGWIFLGPLLVLGIYALIYLEIFHVRATGMTGRQYVVYIFCGLVPYLATAEALTTGVMSVMSNKAVLNNTVFPIDLAPAKSVLTSQAVMAIGMPLVVIGAFLTGRLSATILLLPVIWVLNVLWLMG